MHLQAKEPPKVVSNPDTRGKAWNTFSLRASRRNQPCWYSDLGFLASRTSKFPLFEATHSVVLCYSSHRKLIHHVTLHWQHVSVLVPSQTHQHLALSVILILAFLQGSSSTECAFKEYFLKIVCVHIYVKKKVEVLVTHSCATLCKPMDCSLLDSSVLGVLQTRLMEWVVIPSSSRSAWPRDWTWVSCIAGRYIYIYKRITNFLQQKFIQHCKATILQ